MKGRQVNDWRAHKALFSKEKFPAKKQRVVHYNLYRKIEIYRYIRKKDKDVCIKLIKQVFNMTTTMPSKAARFLIALQGKVTTVTWKGASKNYKIIHGTNTKQIINWLHHQPYYYYHHFIGPVKKRRAYFLIQIYEATNAGNDQLKVEIIHFNDEPRNNGPLENHRRNEEKIRSMLEMTKHIDAAFPLFPAEDHTPHSIQVKTLLRRSNNFLPDAIRIQRAEERRCERNLQMLGTDANGKWFMQPPPKGGKHTGKQNMSNAAIMIV